MFLKCTLCTVTAHIHRVLFLTFFKGFSPPKYWLSGETNQLLSVWFQSSVTSVEKVCNVANRLFLNRKAYTFNILYLKKMRFSGILFTFPFWSWNSDRHGFSVDGNTERTHHICMFQVVIFMSVCWAMPFGWYCMISSLCSTTISPFPSHSFKYSWATLIIICHQKTSQCHFYFYSFLACPEMQKWLCVG